MGLDLGDIARLGPKAQKQIYEKFMAEEQYKRFKKEQRQKYHNVPDTRGDIKFPSKKEARRYDELMLMLKAGEISDLRLQEDFTLQEAYTTPQGKRVRAIRYKADFTYWRDGKKVVEDTKSVATATQQYKMKRKMMMDRFGIEIQEV